MQNLSPEEITTLNSEITRVSNKLTSPAVTRRSDGDSRVNWCELIGGNMDSIKGSGIQLCHDSLLYTGYGELWVKGNHVNGCKAAHVVLAIPKCFREVDEHLQYFDLFMKEIQDTNGFTDDEMGAISFIREIDTNYNIFVYKIGEYFKKTQGLMYIPMKMFRLAAVCNTKTTSILQGMTLTPIFTHNDTGMYDGFGKIIVECLHNLKDIDLQTNFLSNIRSNHEKLKDKLIVQKQMAEKQAKKEAKLAELQAKMTRKKAAAIKVFSRHPSHNDLRDLESTCKILIRLGSTTPTPEKMIGNYVEINSIEGVQNSSSKKRMKNLFAKHNVQTSVWICPTNETELRRWCEQFAEKKNARFVSKSEFGSRGEGNRLHESVEDLVRFFNTGTNKYGHYIVEKYYSYNKEYRLHVSITGECFYSCRKMLKSGTPEAQKWVRNDSTCVWIVEENEMFERPKTWTSIVNNCVLAIKAVGLDVGACDVRVNNEGQFIVLETNSAPSFGDRTLEKYQEQIPRIAWAKLQAMAEKD